MLNDWNSIGHSLDSIGTRHSPEDKDEDCINPYQNVKGAQKKCRHMWSNDTDAYYIDASGRRRCAICGKIF